MTEPGYWMDETSGVLGKVVHKYLQGDELDDRELGVMREYLRQWIHAPAFIGPEVDRLRDELGDVTSNIALRTWLADAFNAGVDPL